MTDADREFNGRCIEDLCRLGDEVLKAYGIGPERAKTPAKVIEFRNARALRNLDRDRIDAANARCYDGNRE